MWEGAHTVACLWLRGGRALACANMTHARWLVPELCDASLLCDCAVSIDSLAEWSKALAPGASPQGRGFEPHSCHFCCAAPPYRLSTPWTTQRFVACEASFHTTCTRSFLQRERPQRYQPLSQFSLSVAWPSLLAVGGRACLVKYVAVRLGS